MLAEIGREILSAIVRLKKRGHLGRNTEVIGKTCLSAWEVTPTGIGR